MDQGAGQGDLLGHPCRVVNNQGPTLILEAQSPQQLTGPFDNHRAIHTAQQTRVGNKLQPGQTVKQPKAVRQDAYQFLSAHGIGPNIMTHDMSRAGVRSQQSGSHG